MTAEPRHERDDDLNRIAHNAITDQAAQRARCADQDFKQFDGLLSRVDALTVARPDLDNRAHQQRAAEFDLHALDLFAQCGLGNVQRLGRPSKMEGIGESEKRTHLADLEIHNQRLSKQLQCFIGHYGFASSE